MKSYDRPNGGLPFNLSHLQKLVALVSSFVCRSFELIQLIQKELQGFKAFMEWMSDGKIALIVVTCQNQA
jgi:2-hydroxy-3-keto-5-methylthiopentenyl-1-phosphate phosphatase